MALRPEEVTSVIKKELERYKTRLRMESTGTVLQVGDMKSNYESHNQDYSGVYEGK